LFGAKKGVRERKREHKGESDCERRNDRTNQEEQAEIKCVFVRE